MLVLRRRRRGFCIFPGYRWCGPGCSGPGAPINDVDACCMGHDLCLSRGISPCQCDYQFINCLRNKMNSHTDKGRKAALMHDFMKVKATFTCGGRRRY
ncbi:phospholipase [Neobacillus novalis]|uniref:phospholipase n=1 Tax=Neobacillus novalis TaxID=220687 RepID=UPI003140567A